MSSQLMQRLRHSCLRWITASGLAAALAGCGVDRPEPFRAADVARELSAASGIPLAAARPPTEVPGVPGLATTLSGAARTGWLTALVFFERSGTDRVLGRSHALAGVTVLRRNNVVVIYRASPAGTDRSASLRRTLARLGSTG